MKERERMFKLTSGDGIIVSKDSIRKIMFLDKETMNNSKYWEYTISYNKLVRNKCHYGGWNGLNISESVKGYMTKEEWKSQLEELSSIKEAEKFLDKLDGAIESVACSGYEEDYKKYESHYFS